MTGRPAPPIPATCAHRPLTPDGLVIPYGNVRLADGGCDFRSHHNAAWLRCWRHGLCQVCGAPIGRPAVLLCGPRQIAELRFDEPPLHPECARYAATACPMVGGRQSHYRVGDTVTARQRGKTCAAPGCDCGGWVPTPGTAAGAGGDPAHAWFAVYASGWSVGIDPHGQVVGGVCAPDQVLRVRAVSEPGAPFERWRPVPDWRDLYVGPPEVSAAL